MSSRSFLFPVLLKITEFLYEKQPVTSHLQKERNSLTCVCPMQWRESSEVVFSLYYQPLQTVGFVHGVKYRQARKGRSQYSTVRETEINKITIQQYVVTVEYECVSFTLREQLELALQRNRFLCCSPRPLFPPHFCLQDPGSVRGSECL